MSDPLHSNHDGTIADVLLEFSERVESVEVTTTAGKVSVTKIVRMRSPSVSASRPALQEDEV